MTPAALAALHLRCFDAAPRPWSAAEFADLLTGQGIFLLTREHGFLLGRVILDEAELLTLAVAPESRRSGIGRSLTMEFAATSFDRGAQTAFLEVAAHNRPARALYAGLGWRDVGLRRNYYAAGNDAVIMRLGH